MYLRNFRFNENEGKEFAKISKDKNPIHIDKIYGYNSFYGYTIVHGVHIILKFLKIKNISAINLFLKINFLKGCEYNKIIKIKNVNRHGYVFYQLIQDGEIKAEIIVNRPRQHNHKSNNTKYIKKASFLINNYRKNKFKNFKYDLDLTIALSYLSYYVGMINPGINSIITEITIKNLNKIINKNEVEIFSSSIDKRFSLIKNILKYKNYIINFNSIVRPQLKIDFAKPKQFMIKKIQSINNNVLIIGGSSGIGYDLMNLLLYNKNINIITTFHKTQIIEKHKNLIKLNINIEKNLRKIFQIIDSYNPLIIYYFPTPKIILNTHNIELIKLYKKYFIDIPIKIIKYSNKYKINFFYPSTNYINQKKFYPYTNIKMLAEKKLHKLNDNNTMINIMRIPEINTKQNLSIYKNNLQNFRDIIGNNIELLNKVFFI